MTPPANPPAPALADPPPYRVPPSPHNLAETLNVESGVAYQIPCVPRFNAPSVSRFQTVLPLTAGAIWKMRTPFFRPSIPCARRPMPPIAML
jgi:hypothetical protein